MALEVGSVIPFEFEVRDASDVLTNPTTISVVVTAPDGTTSTVNPTNPPTETGVFPVDVVAAMEGTYYAVATTTSPTDVSHAQFFYVEATANTVAPVSVADAKEHLRITDIGRDDQIRRYLIAATRAVEAFTNRIWVRASFTETHDGGRTSIVLRRSPVRSVTSVSESGSTVTDYVLRGDSPILVRGTTAGASQWAAGVQNVTVTYVAGAQAVPADVRQGIKETLRVLWDSQGGNSDVPMGAEFDYARPEDVIPLQTKQLLMPYCAPGIG